MQGEILAANILPGVDWLLPSAAHSVGRAPRRILEEKMTSVVGLGAGLRNVLIAYSSAEAELTSEARKRARRRAISRRETIPIRILPSSGLDFLYFELSGPELADIRRRLATYSGLAGYAISGSRPVERSLSGRIAECNNHRQL